MVDARGGRRSAPGRARPGSEELQWSTIGYSPSAGFVITVIATRSDHAGATAWKSTGADLRAYEG
ncbi:MAG TPA: hypothetical protein VIW24_24095 [Aldersonia sp.]